MPEPSGAGNVNMGSLGVKSKMPATVSSGVDLKMQGLSETVKGLGSMVTHFQSLKRAMQDMNQGSGARSTNDYFKNLTKTVAAANKVLTEHQKLSAKARTGSGLSTTPGTSGHAFGPGTAHPSWSPSGGGGGGWFGGGGGGSGPGGSFGGGGGSGGPGGGGGGYGPPPGGGGFGGGGGIPSGPIAAAMNLGGGGGIPTNPVQGLISMADNIKDMMGALAQAGIQFAYNRIEGPTGNRNAMLTANQALGGSATMMGLKIEDVLKGLAQRSPVEGSFSDVLGTIRAGGSVGAQLKGTDARNGFFESVRQMQTLTPGVGAQQIAGTLSGYMSNTKSQQMGVFLGGGAFTMIGKGGRYKSLTEWAEGITKFLQEQRPGADRGKPFTKEDLLAQNFPGSNVNAWFQQMGVPSDMVDYWWQFVMTKAQAGGNGPFGKEGMSQGDALKAAVKSQRGIDLSVERLRNVSQSTRREFNLGSKMQGLYAGRESADRRFNVVMNQADSFLGQMMSESNIGVLMSMLPTPIAELLLPILQKYAGSSAGIAMEGIGALMGAGGGGAPTAGAASTIADAVNKATPPGDPIGDYGPLGGTGTGHMSPDLAQRVRSMQRANPRIKVTSGYRDTVTQNRLHRQGVGRVGPASKSAHTRGWAADLGPESQLGWIQANAHRFGLHTAAGAGEPWHVQRAGTMPTRHTHGGMGDPMVGDFFDSVKGFLGTAMNPMNAVSALVENSPIGWIKDAISPWQKLLSSFIGSGGLSGTIDSATNLYQKAMLTPLSGLVNLFGKFDPGSGGMEGAISDLVNNKATLSMDVPVWGGFSPSAKFFTDMSPSGPSVFDPAPGATYGAQNKAMALGYGDPISGMMPMGNRGGGTIIFQTHITIPGGMSPGMDARRTAATLADRLEDEMAKRLSRKV